MKNTILLLCLIMINQDLLGQFETCNSPTNKNLYDVCFINQDIGVAVGDSGTIVRSIDGGLNWSLIMSNDTDELKKIKFFDTQNGIAIGSDVYLTDDAGSSWTVLDKVNDYLYDVEILNDSTCITSGSPNQVLKSTDKGLSWDTLISNNLNLGIQFLTFVNEDIGYASKFSGSVISSTLKTTDGGNSWTEIADGSGMHITLIEDIVFISEDVGFRGGWYSPHLMRTEDSSNSWQNVVFADSISINDNSIYDFHIDPSLPNSYFTCGWYGNIFKSTDGGISWSELNSGVSSTTSLHGIFFIDDSTGWVVGAGGIILKTTNGGGTVGLSQENNQISLKIFPNPLHTVLHIEKRGLFEIKRIMIYDNSGALIQMENSSEKIDLTNLASGIYYVEIITEKGKHIEKIIKK